MAIDTWKCSCGFNNTIQKEKCIKCNNSIPQRSLDKIMIGELMNARHILDEKYQTELSDRIEKQRSFLSKYTFMITISCSCVFLIWVFIIGFSGGIRMNNIIDRLVGSDAYLMSEVNILTKQTSQMINNCSETFVKKSNGINELRIPFHEAIMVSYDDLVNNLKASGEHINRVIE